MHPFHYPAWPERHPITKPPKKASTVYYLKQPTMYGPDDTAVLSFNQPLRYDLNNTTAHPFNQPSAYYLKQSIRYGLDDTAVQPFN